MRGFWHGRESLFSKKKSARRNVSGRSRRAVTYCTAYATVVVYVTRRREPDKPPAMSTSLKRDTSTCCVAWVGLSVPGIVYAPVSGAWAGPKSRVLIETDLAVVGVVQLSGSGWFAGTVESAPS